MPTAVFVLQLKQKFAIVQLKLSTLRNREIQQAVGLLYEINYAYRENFPNVDKKETVAPYINENIP